MLLQQITPSMSKKMMRKGGGASAMSGQWCPPLASVSGELLPLVGALPCQGCSAASWSLQVYSG